MGHNARILVMCLLFQFLLTEPTRLGLITISWSRKRKRRVFHVMFMEEMVDIFSLFLFSIYAQTQGAAV